MVQEFVDYAANSEGKGGVVGLGIRSEEIKGAAHDSSWRSIMMSIRGGDNILVLCECMSLKMAGAFETLFVGEDVKVF